MIRKLLRLEQWYKNLVIFLPLLFAPHHMLYPLPHLILGFFGFSLISSATYIINDLTDREKDRLHPVKKERPIASGKVTVSQAYMTIALIILASLIIGLFLGTFYSIIIITYFIITNAYSFGLKNIPILDIVIIAINFIFRMTAGITTLPREGTWPHFLFLFSLIIILLTHKRRSDIKLLGEKAIEHKPVLQFYTQKNAYLIRWLATVALAYVLYSFWLNGVPLIFLLSLSILFIITSITFSKKPKLVIKPHYLFRLWYWDILLMLTILSFTYFSTHEGFRELSNSYSAYFQYTYS